MSWDTIFWISPNPLSFITPPSIVDGNLVRGNLVRQDTIFWISPNPLSFITPPSIVDGNLVRGNLVRRSYRCPPLLAIICC